MSNRGVRQLRKLSVFFCDWGASSNGVRELLGSTQLKEFHQNNPHVDLEFIIKSNHHSFVQHIHKRLQKRHTSPVSGHGRHHGTFLKLQYLMYNKHYLVGRSAVEASGKRVVGVK